MSGPEDDLYESLDWRDPYVFYNDQDRCYWLILSARKNAGPVTRRGSMVLYRSEDLKRWSTTDRSMSRNTRIAGVSGTLSYGGAWYLSYSRFSEFGGTIYRVSDSPFGVWRTPSTTIGLATGVSMPRSHGGPRGQALLLWLDPR